MSTVKICKCKQCMAKRKKVKKNTRKIFRKMTNTWRRKGKEGKIKTFCWA